MKRIPLINANEMDAFHRIARRMFHWKRGELRAVKRGYARRFRRKAKADTLAQAFR